MFECTNGYAFKWFIRDSHGDFCAMLMKQNDIFEGGHE